MTESRRANVVGVGLIGGSVGMALRAQGWHVSAVDLTLEEAQAAVNAGAADATGLDFEADFSVVATPVGAIAATALELLEKTKGLVTDVGSTKLDINLAVQDPRFVGGHPMAGSEQDGLGGADAELFRGATWVLTPDDETNEEAFARVRAIVRSFGAEVLVLQAKTHDQLVAQVSHVPHLTAAALMVLADESAVEHRALLRLAAGGFRDMTRISAGRPAIWPDICFANKTAIAVTLDRLVAQLTTLKTQIQTSDTDGLLNLLHKAQIARVNLPTGFSYSDSLVEVSIPVKDKPGQIAAVASLATELDVNILDLEMTHSSEGGRGIVILVVDASQVERLNGGLMALGYRPHQRSLS